MQMTAAFNVHILFSKLLLIKLTCLKNYCEEFFSVFCGSGESFQKLEKMTLNKSITMPTSWSSQIEFEKAYMQLSGGGLVY